MGTALVTGASAGLGLALARHLAREGHDLVLVARDRSRLERVATELRSTSGSRVEVLVADLADREQTQWVCERLADPERPVDLLVNNAGFGLHHPCLENDIAQEEAALDVMVRAVLLTSHAAGRAMRERGRGAIVNVSSVASFMASGTYSAEKAFVTVFSEGLAEQLRGTGVTVTALCPGLTRTEFHGRARMRLPGVPDAFWLDADAVAQEALAAVAAGRVVSVPGPVWKVAATALRALPRPLVRGGLGRMVRKLRRE